MSVNYTVRILIITSFRQQCIISLEHNMDRMCTSKNSCKTSLLFLVITGARKTDIDEDDGDDVGSEGFEEQFLAGEEEQAEKIS